MKYQLIIIGGGPAGYTAAEAAGKAGLSVLLIEKNNLGGVCLNEGCIPTKTLLYSAKTYDGARHASKYAVNVSEVSFDLAKIIARKSKVVRKLVLGVKSKLTSNNVTIVAGEAQIIDKNTVRCGEETYEGDNLILCTGSETFIPPIPGVDSVDYWTHREALDNKELPASLVIVGGGVIGMEFASFFNSLGVQVTVIEMMDEILGGMDKELSALLRADYMKRGIKFLLSTKVVALSQTEEGVVVSYENAEGSGTVVAEKLLMSVGRRPVTKGFGLENLTLEKTERGAVKVNERMQTSLSNVYVCGDLTGFSLLAHTAVREAEVAVHSILGKEDTMSYRAVPGVVYTNPEIAGVGETEESASAKGIQYKVVKLPMAYSGRFVAENEGVNGVCKVLLDEQQRVIGAHVLGNPASEIITLAGTAIELGLTAAQWKKIVFPHPTVGEIFRETL
ncbi:dihydrolipoyl dehydrogenase [Bacteroides finegoldii]|mgnify:FL=1|jgi:dihydrolipoyl dehydrogenase|uniref:Dihydrolipoyl dehydrogenase n=3 Tax=Bacteroides finegoldii TaxID=338188 RepID=A0A174JCL3_9BACE|nr:dihydrolipoyl dehydrogenase [Bacteroides finegoldii]CDC51023.1 dihydrolipoyl dehydrogenase [Bacteroides finegoldii CAG:203]KAA5216069.1 dihydrolipoyl dehydrogenase [Bacteroides finegoldii]KAA5220298.1 dihydrolipoyl dehydrogenase [Bacteroides finegoldii]KAA5224713.1 dihydrolipoyl dehydrogenase [Bacteroides finegoldii]KAA5229332.1 dihydrolipoyl dehydrogenase [Bacteroides finegoldii]